MPRILCLDDDPDVLHVLKEIFESAGYEVLCTAEEQEALHLLHTEAIDLFTQDMVHSGMGGVEFLQKLASEKSLASIPVLVISVTAGWPMEQFLKRSGLEADFDLDGNLAKPFDPVELLDEVEAILTRHSKPLPPVEIRERAKRRWSSGRSEPQ